MTTSRLRTAYEIAKTSNLLDADADWLLQQLLDLGVVWDANLLDSIQATHAHHKRELAENSYAKYLAGGARPARLQQRDWDAKDAYLRLIDTIEMYSTLHARLKDSGENARLTETLGICLRIADIEHGITATAVPTLRIQPDLSAEDHELCFAWAGVNLPQSDAPQTAKFTDHVSDYDAERLSSARAAELAAASYYRDLGLDVQDVSILQLSGKTAAWKDYDLLVAGKPVDVKNARRAFSNPESYVEHAVPAFKLSRHTGAEVAVTGVLSDYRPELSDEGHLVRRLRILGEVRISYLKSLLAWMRRKFGDVLYLDEIWRPDFQPGWVFEFSPEHYPARLAAIEKLPYVLRRAAAGGIGQFALSGWLSALCQTSDESLPPVSNECVGVVGDIRDLAKNVGLARPSIYLYCMGTFVKAIADGVVNDQPAAALRRVLFGLADLSLSSKPLGLEDPQQYVSKVIDALATVQRAVIVGKVSFVAFKLTHPQILRGRTSTGSWLSLLAYCGGWRHAPFTVKCGSSPLIFGRNDPCPKCGYLCCNDCGFCSKGCIDVAERQDKIAENYRLKHKQYYGD